MNHLVARMANPVFIGIAFGIFFTLSCSTIEPTETSSDSSSINRQFDTELNTINNKIQQNPRNAQLYTEKSELLIRFAKSNPPQNRNTIYMNLRDHTDTAASYIGSDHSKLNDLLVNAWNNEQGSAVRLLQQNRGDDSLENFDEILSHLDNAITIIPDSIVTYSLKATTLYENGNLSQAIETLETAQTKSQSPRFQIQEKLAYLYLESGELEKASSIYENLVQEKPDDDHLKHGLVNAYILHERHEEAVTVLKSLSETYPTRYNYQAALATQLYFIFDNKTDQLLQEEFTTEQFDDSVMEITSLTDDIHSLYDSLNADMPVNEENTLRMAVFYKDASSKIADIQEWGTFNDELTEELVEREVNYMNLALPLWERLAEMNPDNLDYLNNLYEVYMHLGMDEEAEAIERSINF